MSITRRSVLTTASAAVATSLAGGSAWAAPPLPKDGFGFLRLLLLNFKDGTEPDARAALAAPLGEGKTVKGFLSAPNTVKPQPNGYAWGTSTAFASKHDYEAVKKIEATQLPKFASYSELHLEKPFFWINPAQASLPTYERHHVLIRFHDDIDAARRDRVIAYIKSKVVGHPHIQSYILAKNILPRGATSHFDWLAATTFASLEDHRIQLDDPDRKASTAVEFLPFADITNFDCKG